jgi:hypothetical protein
VIGWLEAANPGERVIATKQVIKKRSSAGKRFMELAEIR